jgi:hypothetical protein
MRETCLAPRLKATPRKISCGKYLKIARAIQERATKRPFCPPGGAGASAGATYRFGAQKQKNGHPEQGSASALG